MVFRYCTLGAYYSDCWENSNKGGESQMLLVGCWGHTIGRGNFSVQETEFRILQNQDNKNLQSRISKWKKLYTARTLDIYGGFPSSLQPGVGLFVLCGSLRLGQESPEWSRWTIHSPHRAGNRSRSHLLEEEELQVHKALNNVLRRVLSYY